MALRPHRSKYWMHPQIDDWEEFAQRVEKTNGLYRDAARLEEMGIHVVSTDEKTGMQAKERIRDDIPARPGRTRCREYEYFRHGTLCLTANLLVACGTVVAPTIGRTRKEEDFEAHVAQTVATDPNAGWIFILDNLNTHMSERLVRRVAALIGFEGELGGRRRQGILKNKHTRKAFLEDPTHRIRFHYTPKHCSWLNQVEIWFSKLQKRLLSNASFKSLALQEQAIRDFIFHHNTEASPYNWSADTAATLQKIKNALNATIA